MKGVSNGVDESSAFNGDKVIKNVKCCFCLKSDNLQYNTLGRCVNGTNVSSTKRLMFQALSFFIISYRLRVLNNFIFFANL